MKEEYEKLKRLVGEIVQSARGGDPAQLRAAIVDAGSAAGVDLSGLEEAADVPSSGSQTSTEQSTALYPSTALTGHTRYTDTLAAPSSSMEWETIGWFNEQITQNLHSTAGSPIVPHSYDRMGRMSPRLDYGLWPDPDPVPKFYQPPDDIVPFIGAGMHTFAGHIAWACLEYAYSYLMEAGKHVTTGFHSMAPESAAARKFLHQSLRPSEQLHVVAYIAARIVARLEFRKMGYIRGDNPAVNMGYDQMITRRILQSFLDRTEIDQWWVVSDIEIYAAEKMGAARFAAFQKALGRGEVPYIQALRPLTRALAQSFVCAGEGARWRADHGIMVVDAWVHTIYGLEYLPNT